MQFLQRPQSNRLRKALFQVHLWTGITVALWVFVVGATGAALVFRPEFQAAAFPEFFAIDKGGQPDAPVAPVDKIIANLHERYPGAELLGIDYPTGRRGSYLSYLTKGDELITVFSHPGSGAVIGEMPTSSWITKLQDLHFDLLGGSTGRTVNGIGALCLTAMFLTGLVIWWPGMRWKIDLRSGWKRMNWDLHNTTGFWLFGLLLLWAVTGVEFAFREPFRRAVNAISPLTEFRAPESTPGTGGAAADVTGLVAKARAIVPGAKPGRVVVPSNARGAVLILMARVDHGDFDTSDEVDLYFDQYSGELLLQREPALEYASAGDVFMKWIGPLHVGSFGGTGVKALWAILALSFPLLALTGTLMWWNRMGRGWFRKTRPRQGRI